MGKLLVSLELSGPGGFRSSSLVGNLFPVEGVLGRERIPGAPPAGPHLPTFSMNGAQCTFKT